MHYFTIIGLMSGTSMDGINGSVVKTNGKNMIRMNINEKILYDEKTKKLFKNHVINGDITSSKINTELITRITKDHAKLINKIIKTHKIIPDYVGFHGQTIHHDPSKRLSLQIGDPKYLAKIINIKVISDFRKKDIKLGGQGAPLAPIYHQNIIDTLDLPKPTCFVNIGGVSNITYWDGKDLIGFDTGPGNHLLDKFCQEVLNIPYDESGKIASRGKEKYKIIEKFLQHPYFKTKYPKSLDKNHFDGIYHQIKKNGLSHADFLSSLSTVTIKSIIKSIDLLPKKVKLLVIMGGGSFNTFFLNGIKSLFPGVTKTADELGLNSDFIEAELICFLSARFLNNLTTTFPNTTGVSSPTVGGKLYKP